MPKALRGFRKPTDRGQRRNPVQEKPEHVGDLWYFLAALADKLARESQNALYRDLGRLATEIIQ